MVEAKLFFRRCLEQNNETNAVIAHFATRLDGRLAFLRASANAGASFAECIDKVGRRMELDRHTQPNIEVDVAMRWTPP